MRDFDDNDDDGDGGDDDGGGGGGGGGGDGGDGGDGDCDGDKRGSHADTSRSASCSAATAVQTI